MPGTKLHTHLTDLASRGGIWPFWRECQPKILVVTDHLSFSAGSAFGLTQFIDALVTGTVHGMTPQVIKASRSSSLPGADVPQFTFDHATHGVLKSRYDVVFLFGFDGELSNPLTPSEIEALAVFMQAGGGVFATGDHEDLGAAMGRDVPRVRAMRRWTAASTPDVANTTRLSTNLSGANESEEFDDQSDALPQRLYLNFRTAAGGLGSAHPVVQLPPPHVVLEVYPDHPHEGECVVPSNLSTTFLLNGTPVDEWPVATGGTTRVAPEAVGLTVSHGDGFANKAPLLPRAFLALCAYDGQAAGVGRVVTDATWHHYVNVNLDGTGAGTPGRIGLQTAPGAPNDDFVRMREFYRNLATWLMPKNVRRCLRIPIVIGRLEGYPLFEELRLPPRPEWSAAFLRELGCTVFELVRRQRTRWEAEAMLADALEDALGSRARALFEAPPGLGRSNAQDIGFAALGGLTAGVAAALDGMADAKELRPHGTFDKAAAAGAKHAVATFLAERRKELRALDASVAALTG